jgi:regulator of sigma E protease
MLTIFSFLVVLSVLVVVHELGHFLMAKRFGVKVLEFGIGHPPRLFAIKRGETEYSLNAIPLGGFVRMLGEETAGMRDVVRPQDAGRSFSAKSRAQRALILVAGPAMNLLLAPLLLTALFMIGVPQEDPAAQNQVQIHDVVPGSPAARAGLRPGDIIESIDSHPITSVDDLRTVTRTRLGQETTLTVRRGGRTVTVTLTPRTDPPPGQGAIGIQVGRVYTTVSYPLWEALPRGVLMTVQLLWLFAHGIWLTVSGLVQPDVVGPIGIAEMTGRAASRGIGALLQFTAFISLNLAIFNLLPFPGLDGGRLLFVALETVRGRRVLSPQREGLIHFIGIMILLTLILLVSFNDIMRWAAR